MRSKIMTALLAAVLALCLLAGCGSTAQPAATENPAAAETPAASAAETEAPADTDEPAEAEATTVLATQDFPAMYAVYAPDYVPVTVNGHDVTWDRYFGWVYSVMEQLTYYYGISDFTEDLGEGLTYGDYIQDYALSMSGQYEVINGKAAELGITLSEEERSEVDQMLQDDADSYFDGSIEALIEDLNSRYFSEEYYRYMSGSSLLYEDIFLHFYGENGALLPDEDAVNYFLDNGYMNAQHILFKTIDDSNQPLSEEEQAEKLARAEAALEQLKAVSPAELESAFTALMLQQTEDLGAITRPDDYYFTSGTMAQEFEDAAAALEQGEMSEIVKSDYGYHILYRPRVSADHIYTYDASGNPITLRYEAAVNLFSTMVDEWIEGMQVEYADDFDFNAVLAAGKTE